jgi:hypothetical protein
MKTIRPLFVLLFLGACAHQPRRVECDTHLTAINPPTLVVKPASASAPASTP